MFNICANFIVVGMGRDFVEDDEEREEGLAVVISVELERGSLLVGPLEEGGGIGLEDDEGVGVGNFIGEEEEDGTDEVDKLVDGGEEDDDIGGDKDELEV